MNTELVSKSKKAMPYYRMLAAVVTWWKATMLDYPYWRVTYKDGKQTRLLYWNEAKGLKLIFKGKLWIDYNCREMLEKSRKEEQK